MKRRAFGRLALVAGSLLLSFVLAEATVRWQRATDEDPGQGDDDDGWYVRYRRMNETLYARSDDPELIYEPVPGASVEMEYGPARFDSGGQRGTLDAAREPGDAVRVAMVGDSLVWSEFLAEEHTLPRRTADALGPGFEVLNFGVTGYDTTQEAAYYERAVRPYRPRVVVVVYCMNDMMIMSGPFERVANEDERARKDAQEALMERVAPVRRETIEGVQARREEEAVSLLLARALGIVERWNFDRSYLDEYLVTFAQSPARERTAEAIARLGAAIREDGARGLFVISPVLESWDDYHWSPIHHFVREHAEEAGFTVLDPLDGWRQQTDSETMRIGGDNLHYGRRGGRVFGGTVAEAIRDLSR